ncbi:MAG: hypothetical protein LIQ30_12905, partial [Planctomycetes bacterium]|nr:hypothetical protein [Planctomycetota bacterium]
TPEKMDAVPPAMKFVADTKVTPAIILKRLEDEAAKKEAAQSETKNIGPRTETRANGRRIIRHN